MSSKDAYSRTTWSDVADCVGAWEDDQQVLIRAEITFNRKVKGGAFVEVVLLDNGWPDRPRELHRERHPVNMHKSGVQAGQVMYAVFSTLNTYEGTPWLWSDAKRKRNASM